MGMSWGGCLGTAYLIDSSHREKVAGWIEIDGAHNEPGTRQLSPLLMMNYAEERIAQGDQPDKGTSRRRCSGGVG